MELWRYSWLQLGPVPGSRIVVVVPSAVVWVVHYRRVAGKDAASERFVQRLYLLTNRLYRQKKDVK